MTAGKSACAAVILALVFTAVTAPPSPAAFQFIREFGSGNGMQSGPGQLSTPQGVGFSPSSGDLFVADSNNNRVQEFGPRGLFRLAFGTAGSMNGQFTSPNGLGVNR